jgi:DNA-binding SARP family transcriptional activator
MKRALARLTLLGLLVGTPLALGSLVGSPMVPDFRGSDLSGSYVPVETVLRLIGLLSWAIWVYLAFAVLLHGAATVAASRGVPGQRLLLAASSVLTPKVVRSLVEFAVGSTLVATSLSVHASSALPAVRPPVSVEAAPSRPSAHVFNHAGLTEPTRELYRVQPGDSLWRIAERKLGSGFRWREIYRMNEGKQFSDGRSLTDPHLICPGWLLDLPEEHRAPAQPADAGELEHPSDEEHETQISPPPTRSPRPIRTFESPTEHVEAQPSVDVEADESGAPALADPALQIPSGLIVAASFASGLITAHFLGRLHRRRSRRLSGVASVKPPDTPELIQDLRRAGASDIAAHLDVAVDAVIEAWHAHTGSWPHLIGAVEAGRHVSLILRGSGAALPPSSGGTISPRVRFASAGPSVLAQVDGPFPAQLRPPRSPLERGLLVPLGRSPDGSVVHVSASGIGRVSLAGPAATGLAQQLVVAAATQGGPDDLRLAFLGSSEEMRELCHLPQTSACGRWEDASDALRDVELELIRRARLFLREGVEDIHSHLAKHSDEQLPALLVACEEPPPALRGRIEALAQQAPTLGAAVVAVGWTLAGDELRALVRPPVQLETDLPFPKLLEPFLLDDNAQQDAIEVIREAYPSESGEEPVPDESVETVEETPTPTFAAVQVPHGPPRLVTEPGRPLPPPGESLAPPPHMLAIRCLGPLEISRAGESIPTGWRAKGRELLAYLVAHPAGAPKERIIDEIWPDIEPRVGVARFDRCATYVRATARGMEDSRMYVERVGESAYRLDESAWWVDAWEYERLIREAERSKDADVAVIKFRDAVALYRGEFCDDAYYPWLDGVRERFRNLFVEACGRLAYLLSTAQEHDQALSVLERAIETDPVCEDLVRRAIAVEAALGRRAAALARYRKLEITLDEQLSVEPDPETRGLVERLLGPRQRAG